MLYTIEGETLTEIANAIREKRETEQPYKPEEMAEAILGIEGGGIPFNFAFGETAPTDTNKLWIKSDVPEKIFVSNRYQEISQEPVNIPEYIQGTDYIYTKDSGTVASYYYYNTCTDPTGEFDFILFEAYQDNYTNGEVQMTAYGCTTQNSSKLFSVSFNAYTYSNPKTNLFPNQFLRTPNGDIYCCLSFCRVSYKAESYIYRAVKDGATYTVARQTLQYVYDAENWTYLAAGFSLAYYQDKVFAVCYNGYWVPTTAYLYRVFDGENFEVSQISSWSVDPGVAAEYRAKSWFDGRYFYLPLGLKVLDMETNTLSSFEWNKIVDEKEPNYLIGAGGRIYGTRADGFGIFFYQADINEGSILNTNLITENAGIPFVQGDMICIPHDVKIENGQVTIRIFKFRSIVPTSIVESRVPRNTLVVPINAYGDDYSIVLTDNNQIMAKVKGAYYRPAESELASYYPIYKYNPAREEWEAI